MGAPWARAPDNLQPTPRTLSLDEIDALVAYLQARIVGHGKVTRAECLSYFEGKGGLRGLQIDRMGPRPMMHDRARGAQGESGP